MQMQVSVVFDLTIIFNMQNMQIRLITVQNAGMALSCKGSLIREELKKISFGALPVFMKKSVGNFFHKIIDSGIN